jgi:hydrogenase maturation protein HypF
VHHLLLESGGTLVMTSANRSDEPICFTAEDAATRLPVLADAVLDHDRPIHVPCDDSVVGWCGRHVTDPPLAGVRPCRWTGPAGARRRRRLKNTSASPTARWPTLGACRRQAPRDTARSARDRAAHRPAWRAVRLRRPAPRLPHPRLGGAVAGDRPLDLVQHHHAHVVALLAEHGRLRSRSSASRPTAPLRNGRDDLGRQILCWARQPPFHEAAHLAPVLLPAATRPSAPHRMALAHLYAAGSRGTPTAAGGCVPGRRTTAPGVATGHRHGLRADHEHGPPLDAVASLLGIRHESRYEAEAAMALEYGSPCARKTLPERRFPRTTGSTRGRSCGGSSRGCGPGSRSARWRCVPRRCGRRRHGNVGRVAGWCGWSGSPAGCSKRPPAPPHRDGSPARGSRC